MLNSKREYNSKAIKAIENILANPSQEQAWIMHGYIIKNPCHVLSISDQFEYFMPKFYEVQENDTQYRSTVTA